MDAEANYKNFSELADYARMRAERSAKRCGHQEFAYWVRVMKWARTASTRNHSDLMGMFRTLKAVIDNRGDKLHESVFDMAWTYAMAVHLRKMLVNQGCDVERLSLQWLREEAALLGDDE